MVNESTGKLQGGVGRLDGMLADAGLPAFFKHGTYVGAVLAVIAGFCARVGAWLIAVNMLFAFGPVHGEDLLAMVEGGGLQLEAQYMFFFSAIALALVGPGRYAFNQR
jgi:putative oxidoreductase